MILGPRQLPLLLLDLLARHDHALQYEDEGPRRLLPLGPDIRRPQVQLGLPEERDQLPVLEVADSPGEEDPVVLAAPPVGLHPGLVHPPDVPPALLQLPHPLDGLPARVEQVHPGISGVKQLLEEAAISAPGVKSKAPPKVAQPVQLPLLQLDRWGPTNQHVPPLLLVGVDASTRWQRGTLPLLPPVHEMIIDLWPPAHVRQHLCEAP
ncbi:MAG: hypothetical protein VX633_15790, partial [Verrucomicrobiota bacterium]|nr:hypothetical protein [Verrucomicrobiota bacterium]